MLALVNKLTAHVPISHVAKWKEMLDLGLLGHNRVQVHFHAQRLQEIDHKVVDDIGLVALAYTV